MRNDCRISLLCCALVLLVALGACAPVTVAPGAASTSAAPTLAPTPEPERIEGGVGVVDGEGGGYLFRGEEGARYPIEGRDDVVTERITRAAAEGRRVQIWGDLVERDGEGARVRVARLDFLTPDYEPTRAPEAAVAWEGAVARPPGNPHALVFVREDGEGYDVSGQEPQLREALEEALASGARVRIWGAASYGVPASRARHIEITRVELVED